MELKINISQENHDIVFSQLRKVQKTIYEGLIDKEGKPILDKDSKPVLGHVEQFDEAGNAIMLDALTVLEWDEQALLGKVNDCRKTAGLPFVKKLT